MGFGTGYQARESLQLEEGIYDARINSAEYVQRGGYNILDVTFSVRGKAGYKPDRMSFFDRPQDADGAVSWDLQMTKFFDAFGIQRGNFDVNHWRGAIGKITVVKDKKNPQFMKVYPYLDKGNQMNAAAFAPSASSAPADDFKDDDLNDIPF